MPIRMLTVARTKPHVHARLKVPEAEQHAAGEEHVEHQARAEIEDLKAQAEVTISKHGPKTTCTYAGNTSS